MSAQKQIIIYFWRIVSLTILLIYVAKIGVPSITGSAGKGAPFLNVVLEGQIRARYQEEPEVHFEGDGVPQLCRCQRSDIIVTTEGTNHSDLRLKVFARSFIAEMLKFIVPTKR